MSWILAALRRVGLAPSASALPPPELVALSLAGVSAGAIVGARFAGQPSLLRRLGRRQLALAILAAGTTVLLPMVGPGAALLLAATALGIGAVSQVLHQRPGALLLGAAGATLSLGGPALWTWGARAVSWTAAAGMALTGVAALTAAGPSTTRPDRPPETFALALPPLVGGALVGAWATLAARLLEPYTGGSIHARAMLAFFVLLALAAGLGAIPPWRHPGPPLLLLASVGAIASLALYGQLDRIVPEAARRLGGIASWPRALALMAAESVVLLAPVLVPLAGALARPVRRGASGLGWLALGALAATLGTPHLITVLGAPASLGSWIVATLIFAAGTAAVRLAGTGRAVAVALALALLIPTAWLARATSAHAPFDERYGPLLYFMESGTHAVLVTDDPEQGRLLRTSDGRSLGGVGTDPEDRTDAQIPMLLHPSVRRVLLLGFGVGNAASSVLAHPIERLDVVDPTGVAAAVAGFFDESNLDVLTDDRLTLHAGDPWAFLRRTGDAWDVVQLTVDCLENGAACLPTRDRLELVRRHLRPGGVVSLRLNVGRASMEEIRSVLATMAAVFPFLTVWDGPLGYTWVINGSEVQRAPDPRRRRALLGDPDVEAELAALDLDDPRVLRSHFVRGTAGARALARGAPVITTNLPRVDQAAARSADTFFGLGSAAADTGLADLTAAGGRENVGLARLLEKLQRTRGLKEPAAYPGGIP